jgi:hypothetical protein
MATAVAPRIFKNFINGEWMESCSGKAYENRNPANTDELVGMFVSSNEEDVELAVAAAKEAYKTWRLVPAPKRAEILFRAAELLVQRKEEFSKDMTREMGKVLAETRGDVQEAIDMTYHSFRTSQQICNERETVHRGVWADNALEFSDGHSVLENDADAHQRKYSCFKAGRGHTALFVSPRSSFDGSGSAARRCEFSERRRAQCGRATC